jgi:hypothetical protein
LECRESSRQFSFIPFPCMGSEYQFQIQKYSINWECRFSLETASRLSWASEEVIGKLMHLWLMSFVRTALQIFQRRRLFSVSSISYLRRCLSIRSFVTIWYVDIWFIQRAIDSYPARKLMGSSHPCSLTHPVTCWSFSNTTNTCSRRLRRAREKPAFQVFRSLPKSPKLCSNYLTSLVSGLTFSHRSRVYKAFEVPNN